MTVYDLKHWVSPQFRAWNATVATDTTGPGMKTILKLLLFSTFFVSCLSGPRFQLIETEDEGEGEGEGEDEGGEDEVESSQEDSLPDEKDADYR